MAINRISEIIQMKQWEKVTPSEQTLNRIGVKLHTWNKWVAKKKDPEFHQVPEIAKFLGCKIVDLFPEKTN